LNQEILPLQGYKPVLYSSKPDLGLGIIEESFPNKIFPLAAIHEFRCQEQEDEAPTGGFIAGLLSPILTHGGTAVWISRSPIIFPPALSYFGLPPERVIFVAMQKDKDILWAGRSIKVRRINGIIGEIKELSFKTSKISIAVEHSNVTGFIIRRDPQQLNTTASVTHWKIRSLPSDRVDDLPGIGFPRWQVNLEKVRNGKPGSWQMEWVTEDSEHCHPSEFCLYLKKTG
jgi:protein ImuA